MSKLLIVVLYISSSAAFVQPKKNSRIIGGENANISDYPFVCSLQLKGEHYCGSSIINEKYLLTAAHCVLGIETDSLSVNCGITHLNETDSGAQIIQVNRAIAHPDYNGFFKVNDIAIIEIAQTLQFVDDKIQPIEMENECTNDVSVPCEVVGWGWTDYPGSISNTLQKLNSETQTLETCQQYYLFVISTNLCALTKTGEGACKGDSGGPLIVNGKLTGIVSYGRQCAEGYPDVYTKVACFTDWIKEQLQQ